MKNNNITTVYKERLRLALSYQKNGDIKQAEAIYRMLITNEEAQEIVYSQLALICAKSNRIKEAKKLASKALDCNPASIESSLLLGDIFRSERNYSSAVTHYRVALQKNPNIAIAQYNLSISLSALGLLDESIASCRLAIKLNPDLLQAKFHLGQVFMAQNNNEKAKTVFENLIN